MLKIYFSARFKRDYRLAIKRGCEPRLFEGVVDALRCQRPLPEKNRDHALSGDYVGHRECHIAPDWLLIYKVDGENLILTLVRTGSHSDLF